MWYTYVSSCYIVIISICSILILQNVAAFTPISNGISRDTPIRMAVSENENAMFNTFRGIVASTIAFGSFGGPANAFETPQVNIPTVISKLHPLPQESLVTSYNRGNSYLMLGQFDDALVQFNEAAELAPQSMDVFLSRGIVLEKLLRWDDAIADYNKANTIYKKRPFAGDDPTVISNIANAETGLLQWENALRDFTKAAQLKSDFLAPRIGRALVLYQLDRPEETFQYFKTLSIKYPYFPDGNAVLAALYFEKGDITAANDSWENAVEEDSRYEDLDWVLNIRRWPPKLVATLTKFKESFSASLDLKVEP